MLCSVKQECRALQHIPDRLCCLADSSCCPTESWLPLSTSAVKSSLHRQHMLMLEALTLPSCCARPKSCSRSYICQCLEASLSACAQINCLNGPELTCKAEGAASSVSPGGATKSRPALTFRARHTVRCAARADSFMYLELQVVMALDQPFVFLGGHFSVHEPVLRARLSSDVTNRYWSSTSRAYLPLGSSFSWIKPVNFHTRQEQNNTECCEQ